MDHSPTQTAGGVNIHYEHHEMTDHMSFQSSKTDILTKYKRGSWLEKKGGYEVDDPGFAPSSGLQRKMKNRHIAMISIGGVIGTGLFLVSKI
jgi:amino acid permease